MDEITKRFIAIYNHLLSEQKIRDQKDFATKIGISTSMMTEIIKGRSNIGLTAIQNTVLKFDINSQWLFRGTGDMYCFESLKGEDAAGKKLFIYESKRIPLVSVAAVGGFGNAKFEIKDTDVKDYYVVPKFRDRKIDFMIEVYGSSMQPKYNSGDVIACTIIKESQFIQWNKVHIISTKEQGILLKRLKQGSSPEYLYAISDNKDYDPFEIPVNEITGMAIVVGVIRLE